MYTTAHVKCQGIRRSELMQSKLRILQQDSLNANYYVLYTVPVNCTTGEIRLRGGTNQREGRVEICIDRIWGTICDTSWDNREAQVACRQLGFSSNG